MKPMFQTMFSKVVPLFCALALTACGGAAKKSTTAEIPAQPAYNPPTILVAGSGDTVAAGDLATVNYTGWFYDSTKANSRGAQFETGSRSFAAGTGGVMPGTSYTLLGWDQGVVSMKVGGKINLILPYNLAYGAIDYTSPQSNTKVPAYTPVVFEIEVVSVKKASPSAAVALIDTVPGTGAAVEYSKTYVAKYTGWLSDTSKAGCTDKDAPFDISKADYCKGKQFATSTDGTFSFSLNGGLIKGWDRGVLGMKVGGKRTVIIPSELGYGVTGLSSTDTAGVVTVTVPPNTPLVYEIEVTAVK